MIPRKSYIDTDLCPKRYFHYFMFDVETGPTTWIRGHSLIDKSNDNMPSDNVRHELTRR